MSTVTRPNNNLSSGIVQIPGPPNLLNSGDISGSPPLQASAEPKNCYLGQSKNVRSRTVSKPSSQSGNSLVERSSPCMEWQGSVSGPSRSYNRDRCFSKGLGSPLPRSEYRWPLVFGRKEITHQLPRASSGLLCYQNIHQNQSLCSCQTVDGQCISSCLYQQDGRYPFPKSFESCNRPVGMVLSTSVSRVGTTSTWAPECESRPGISRNQRFQRLETQSDSVSGTFQNVGPFPGRLICIPADTSTTHIRQLETRSTGGLHRCIFSGLGENSGLCLSTLCPNRSLSTTATGTGGGPPSAGGTSMANSIMVPITTADEYRPASTHPTISSTPQQGRTIAPPNQPSISWVEAVSKNCQTAELSEEVRKILLAAWRQSTGSAYSSAWSKWVSWCTERETNPLSASIETVLEFLTEQFNNGKAYRSINVYRSALSAVLPLVDTCKIGSHPLVSQLLKGMFNLRPPQPRYSHTWNVAQVLTYTKSIGVNKDLNLKMLSFKLVTLLGLTAPDRSSDLAKRDLRFCTFLPEGVSFTLPGLTKTSKPGDLPKTSFHAAFRADMDLCPVECLRVYLDRTKGFRSNNKDQQDKLFLSFVIPHKPVSSATLARWIKSYLQLAGIDTSIFSAHSLRGASTTAALNQGVSLADILKMANWSQESTFTRFYYKPQFNTVPGNAVLSAYHS